MPSSFEHGDFEFSGHDALRGAPVNTEPLDTMYCLTDEPESWELMARIDRRRAEENRPCPTAS